MRLFLKLADYNWKPGSQMEMIYENDQGEFFLGPAHQVEVGSTYLVEVNNQFPEDGYHRIIKFIE